jgi:hypothetical protein
MRCHFGLAAMPSANSDFAMAGAKEQLGMPLISSDSPEEMNYPKR